MKKCQTDSLSVRLPSRYLITPEPSANTQEFLDGLERSLRWHPAPSMDGQVAQVQDALERPSGDTCLFVNDGIRLVQLRAKTLDETAYRQLARQALLVCHAYQAQLILNAPPALVEELGADGVHLDSSRLMSLSTRPFPSSATSSEYPLWVAASCHNAKELAHAGQLGVDFAVVSPVLETASHPGVSPLGWAGFRELTELAVLPVYALGGMTQRHIQQVCEHGGQGIAAVSSLWRG